MANAEAASAAHLHDIDQGTDMELVNDDLGGRASYPSNRVRTCNPSVDQIHAYMDGTLETSPQDEVGAHLEECGVCRDIYNFEMDLRGFVRSRLKQETPDDLRRRVLDSIAQVRASHQPI